MCRCCQSCWEDIYWNCCEEKYCYDETIANYNPEEDDTHSVSKKNGLYIENSLRVPSSTISPITSQPVFKDDEFRREIQTTVPVLAPEILEVFKNSLIFKDQVKTLRSSTTSFAENRESSRKINSEEKLIKRLEADEPDLAYEKTDEVILRPRFKKTTMELPLETIHQKQPLRNVQSVPHLKSLVVENDNKVFTISHAESLSRISMTPEVPSISFANLPKNYEDTPTIEKFRNSTSLYSIQTNNEAKATEKNELSMPRYYRKSGLVGSPSSENFKTISEESIAVSSSSRKHLVEKSKRLQIARLQLPPLHIRQKKDDSKNIQ